MIVTVLGSAAGGGVPQWNCTCANCTAARAGRLPRRTQSGVAIGVGDRTLLLNCSPDIGMQIEATPTLQPHALRGTPISGMLFTDANVDHLGGLATLRQSGDHTFTLRSSAVVREIAAAQPAFAPFARTPHRWLAVAPGAACGRTDENDPVGAELRVRAVAVPGLTPGYDGRRSVPGAVTAYAIADVASGAKMLFAPVFADLDDGLRSEIERVDVAFLDGSFFSDDELAALGLMRKRARELGHLPAGGPGGTLERLAGVRTRIIFTHLNNSNPMLDPSSEAYARIDEFGAEIAFDGMSITL